jgi:excisionase family DNA binding protein
MSEFLSIKDVMGKLKISRGTVLKHIKSGKLLAYRIGRVVRVDPAELASVAGVSHDTIKRDAKFAEDPS